MVRVVLLAALLAALMAGCQKDDSDQPPPAVTYPWLERGSWTVSSIPVDEAIDSLRGRLRWYNPNSRDAVPVQDVYPDRELNSQVANTLPSLILELKPDGSQGNPERSWGGVMRYLDMSERDFPSPPRYFEFALELPSNLSSNPNARLVFDLGVISEDALPNDTLDSEDLPLPGQVRPGPRASVGNGTLEPNEDTGLDGKFGVDPSDSAYWNGSGRPPVPSWDDWQFSAGSNDFIRVNGTEHNGSDQDHGSPDTEDLNHNQTLDLTNAYFSYSISLSDSSVFGVGGNPENRWRYYSIPLQNPYLCRTVGAANLADIPNARFYLTGIQDTTHFTRIELVDIVLKSER